MLFRVCKQGSHNQVSVRTKIYCLYLEAYPNPQPPKNTGSTLSSVPLQHAVARTTRPDTALNNF